jgi:uncharacterized protein YegL
MQKSRADFLAEFTENPEARCPCLLLFDTAGMIKTDELNIEISKFKADLMSDAVLNKRIEICAVDCSNVEIISDFLSPSLFEIPKLSTSRKSSVAAAFLLGLQMLKQRREIYKENGISCYRPVVLLVSAGAPSDDWEIVANIIGTGENANSLSSFIIVPNGANLKTLSHVASKKLIKLNKISARNFFGLRCLPDLFNKSSDEVIRTRSGENIKLTQAIAGGGEGAIFEIEGQTNIVAKIYHFLGDAYLEQKLQAMLCLKTPELEECTAWPLDVLYSKNSKAIGFIMPKLDFYQSIHELSSPGSRKEKFPEADFLFLINVSINLCRAFSSIHKNGCIVGDVNSSGVFVSRDTRVRFIDCDSFQVYFEGRFFPCLVGKSEYSPPELSGNRSADFLWTANHDFFALAVLIFQLLCLGRHPFAAVSTDKKEISIQSAIAQSLFAFSASASLKEIRPPPNSVSLNAFGPEISTLFERAFSYAAIKEGRPTPEDWIVALQDIRENLNVCSEDNQHKYYRALYRCPWCEIEEKIGTKIF